MPELTFSDRAAGGGSPEAIARRGRRLMRVLAASVMLLAIAVLVLVVILALHTVHFTSKQVHPPRVQPREPLPGHAERLARAIQFPTVAADTAAATNPRPFLELRAFLETSFPRVHARLEREIHGAMSLLYRWKGSDPASEPILLMSHLDVVPVEDNSKAKWTHPPFSGEIADGYIWGRGALDVKAGALGMLEAVERLLTEGFHPECDVYLALGHDEEQGGTAGNLRIAESLRTRGVHFRFVLDEGGGLTEGIIGGFDRAVAYVGIAEKGYGTIRVRAEGPPGHSSMPPAMTAIGRLSAAIDRLQSRPFPRRLDGATAAMLDYLGPEMNGPRRIALANRWLTEALILREFEQKPSMNALIRTTMAPTMTRGGVAPNVLPAQAETLVNLRLLPGETLARTLQRVQDVIADPQVHCDWSGKVSEPSAVPSTGSESFHTLQRTISEIFPEAVVAPGLCMAATDSRHFAPLARDIYRFLPLRLKAEDLERIHGVDERIAVTDYANLIGFCARLIENSTHRPVQPD